MNVKGTAVRARLQFLRETFGPERLEGILGALSDEDRRILESVLPTSWTPVEALDRLDVEVVRHGGGLELAREYGAFSARRNLTRVYRVFLDQAAGDPQILLESLATLHASFFDAGGMRVDGAEPGSCRLEIDFAGHASRFRCQVSRGFVEESLRMLEVQELDVAEVGCATRGAPCCAFAVRWKTARGALAARELGPFSSAPSRPASVEGS